MAEVEARKVDGVGTNRRKISPDQAVARTGLAGGLSLSILWALGCIKGNQFYMPDDALVLLWATWMSPLALAAYRKLAKAIGVEEE